MRKFVTRPFGDVVDLDDPQIYAYLPQNAKELRSQMFSEIGYAFCYMNFWHKDIFNGERCGGQKQRVELLVENFTNSASKNYQNILWYQEQIFLFQDEIENMC